jgi:hypothetical protein
MGMQSATIRQKRGLRVSVILLIAPSLPAESRLEDGHHTPPFVPNPLLQLGQLHLQSPQLLFVVAVPAQLQCVFVLAGSDCAATSIDLLRRQHCGTRESAAIFPECLSAMLSSHRPTSGFVCVSLAHLRKPEYQMLEDEQAQSCPPFYWDNE